MDVAVQDARIARLRKRGARGFRGAREDAPVARGGRLQLPKPDGQRNERGERLRTRGMQRGDHIADDAGGLVVAPAAGVFGQ